MRDACFIRLFGKLCVLLLALGVFGVAELHQTAYAEFVDRRAQAVLVVYNSNALDAEEIARYYQTKRAIPESALCSVTLPAGLYASKDELLGARKTILEDCICKLIPQNVRPVPCGDSTIDEIARLSPISHLALIRGIPARLTGTGWPSDLHEPSLDYYLAHLIYKPVENIFFDQSTGSLEDPQYPEYGKSFTIAYSPVQPNRDRMAVYGRIEALTKESTFALIDRTLNAENAGFSGNILWASYSTPDTELRDYLWDLLGDDEENCSSYIQNSTEWPHLSCRLGESTSGKVPGEGGSTPRAINTGLYLGANPYGNNQAGFNGQFSVMKHWHKKAYDCIELCKDFTDPLEVAQCRQNSTDTFRELNTDCVGGASGLLGHQVRSHPVQYYGVFPPGWGNYSWRCHRKGASTTNKRSRSFQRKRF